MILPQSSEREQLRRAWPADLTLPAQGSWSIPTAKEGKEAAAAPTNHPTAQGSGKSPAALSLLAFQMCHLFHSREAVRDERSCAVRAAPPRTAWEMVLITDGNTPLASKAAT
jgi:hypothetical protein